MLDKVDVGRVFLQRAADYARDVRDDKVVVCKYVKLAVKRWFDDLEFGHERGLYFDVSAALRHARFIGRYCRHSEGEWAGKIADFEPWQCFIEANIHGWMNEDGTRRFRVGYEEVARKNGKTFRMSGNGNYYLVGDNEPGAQVYSAATKRDQAREIFEGALEMVRQDRTLQQVIVGEEHKIKPRKGRGRFVPLSKDSKRMDGFNVHAGLIDEVHAHKDSSLYNVIRSGTGARRQPIMRMITTAGFDRKCFCYEQRARAIKVLEGTVQDDSLFAIIYTVDDPEKWDDEREWIKANPNLNVSVNIRTLREKCAEAKDIPDQKVEFLTKNLNIWTYGQVVWMNMEKWQQTRNTEIDGLLAFSEACKDSEFYQAECYGGLDLANVEDIASLTIVFKNDNKRIVFNRGYLPQAALERRLKEGDPTLEKFKESGHLIVLPGEIINYDFIKKDILNICEWFDVQGIAFDRWNSSKLVNELIEKEIPMVQFGQGYASMTAPTKETMRLVLSKDLVQNDPLLTWAVSNAVATKDPAGNIKLDKSKVSEKIDPAISTVMAIALAMDVDVDDGSDQCAVDLDDEDI